MKLALRLASILLMMLVLMPESLMCRVVQAKDFKSSSHPRYNPKTKKIDKIERRLSENDDSAVDKLNEDIENLNLKVKECMSEEFAKSPAEIMSFSDILIMCVGENYSIVLQTYNSILFDIKEITKERIKNSMQEGFCDDILFMCIEYFRAVELFIKLDYDITKSIEFNRKEMERKINPQKLDYLIQISSSKLDDYDHIRGNLIKEKEFIAGYYQEMKKNYIKRHQGDIKKLQEDD